VIVTAHLARPVSPHDAPPLPTDHEQNDPNDIQLFLFGAMGGGGQANSHHSQQQSKLEEDPRRRTASRAMMDRGPSGELGFIR
jgi:pilus assembly protein CpaC